MEKEEGIESEVYLVTTAHVSEKSVQKVEKAIEELDPDVVGVELDINRFNALKNKERNKKNSFSLFRGNIFLGILQKLLSMLQNRVGEDLGVEPGAEMLKAIELAEEKDIPIALLDRDIRVTLKRMWSKMTFLEKIKIFGALILGLLGFGRKKVNLEEITEKETVEYLISELRNFSPGAAETIIDERDAYIASKIIDQAASGKDVLAVVGAGHEKGIVRFIKNYEKLPDIKELNKV